MWRRAIAMIAVAAVRYHAQTVFARLSLMPETWQHRTTRRGFGPRVAERGANVRHHENSQYRSR